MTDEHDPAGATPLTVATIASGLAAVVVVVGLFGAWVSGGLGGVEVPASTTTPAAGRVATTAPPRPSSIPASPADDPTLRSGARRIEFAGTGPLASVPGLGAWTAASGRWERADGSARLVGPGPVRSLVVLHPAEAPAAVQVTLARVAVNAGLVVRYQDERHYVMLVAVPEQHALWLARVDGDPVGPQLLLAVGGLALADGTRVGLRIAPDRLAVVVNGVVAGSVADERFAGSAAFGLVGPGALASDPAGGDPSLARFGPLLVG